MLLSEDSLRKGSKVERSCLLLTGFHRSSIFLGDLSNIPCCIIYIIENLVKVSKPDNSFYSGNFSFLLEDSSSILVRGDFKENSVEESKDFLLLFGFLFRYRWPCDKHWFQLMSRIVQLRLGWYLAPSLVFDPHMSQTLHFVISDRVRNGRSFLVVLVLHSSWGALLTFWRVTYLLLPKGKGSMTVYLDDS